MPMYTMRASSSLLGRSGGLDLRPKASPRLHMMEQGSGTRGQVHKRLGPHALPRCVCMQLGILRS